MNIFFRCVCNGETAWISDEGKVESLEDAKKLALYTLKLYSPLEAVVIEDDESNELMWVWG